MALPSDMRAELRERGWLHWPSAGMQNFRALAESLGEVVQKTNVAVNPNSKALITSVRPLDFHTDHSKVDYVAWLCRRPAAEGGESLLADARTAYSLLDEEDKKTLETVMLMEHHVFDKDPLRSPLVSHANGATKFYYSFWLADKNMPQKQRKAFDAFRRAVSRTPFHEFKLQKDDVLVVDNSRILHGRRAIKDPNRRLQRVWIRSAFNHQP
ncbi:MAG: TauD/TfdA family dioxygenase [Gammaproteobacteria bacterium]|nr:TauD/TfdA family dioxygenase [Gammaproteobacteria bacterium]